MRAARLRKLVTIERQAFTDDTFGEPIASGTTTVGTAWAAIEPIPARELDVARQLRADVSHKVTLRFNPSIAIYATDRLRLGSRYFELVGPPINTDERNQEWRVLVVEIPTQGV
jgi:head-tail adaptor